MEPDYQIDVGLLTRTGPRVYDGDNALLYHAADFSNSQLSIPPGSVNEYQLRLGRQKHIWFIPLADECGVCR